MFRKKRQRADAPHGSGGAAGAAIARPTEPRPGLQPELPRRPIDIPASPGAAPPAPAAADRNRAADTADQGKRLIVGPGISLSGEITACDRLVVQGSVQVTLNETKAIEITESGRFTNGKAEVEDAEISGVYEGELTVRNRLLIRSTGRVTGNVRYGEIEIERGGRMSGSISMLESGPKTS